MWPRTVAEISAMLGLPIGPIENPNAVLNSLSTDSRKVANGQLFIAIRGEKHDGHDYVDAALSQGAEIAIVMDSWLRDRPALSRRCLGVTDTTEALRRIARQFREAFNFPVLAVGGSNGKTTTKEMLASLLRCLPVPVTRTHKSENGFLGLALTLTQSLHHSQLEVGALIAEIGIDDVGAMSEHVSVAQPNFAMLTALGPEHLSGLGSWDKAVEEELVLFRECQESCARIWQCCEPRLYDILDEARDGDTIVCELEQLKTMPAGPKQLAELGKISVLSFDVIKTSATSSLVNCTWKPAATHKNQTSWSQSFEVPMPGRHNANNFALALAAAANISSEIDSLIEAWKSFVQPEMRSRIVKLNKDVTLYDDCYNSSPSSLDAALSAMHSPEWSNKFKILVLGDMLDLGTESKTWHLKLSEKLLKTENSHLCLFGSAMYDVYNELITKHNQVLETANISLCHLAAEKNPALFLPMLNGKIEGSVVLVKGSRGMDMGRFVKVCEDWSAAQG